VSLWNGLRSPVRGVRGLAGTGALESGTTELDSGDLAAEKREVRPPRADPSAGGVSGEPMGEGGDEGNGFATVCGREVDEGNGFATVCGREVFSWREVRPERKEEARKEQTDRGVKGVAKVSML
jgi:hypothetical protein